MIPTWFRVLVGTTAIAAGSVGFALLVYLSGRCLLL